MPRNVLARRALAALAAAALAGVGLTVAPALAAPVPGTLMLSNNDEPGVLLTGTNFSVLASRVTAPCDAAATRQRLRVIAATATDPLQQSAIAPWVTKNFYSPVAVGLPGPLSTSASNTWQGLADLFALPLVPGTYEFALQCTNNLGTVFYEEFQGDTVTFTSPTAWRVNQVLPPGPVLVATTTTVTAAPASVTTGQNVTLTATVAETSPDAPTGTVAFSVGGGTAVSAPVNASGVATTTVVAGAAVPVNNVSAVYSGDAAFLGSTGTTTFAVTGVVVPPSATVATLAVTPNPAVSGQSIALNGTVANSVNPAVIPVGTCQFRNGASIIGTAPVSATGSCSISRTFPEGAPSLSLNFVPTSALLFVTSSSAAVVLTVSPVVVPPGADEQTITVEIPAGAIVIQTPYTPTNPLALGMATLAADGSSYSASAPFNQVKVIDTRAGNPGWSAFIDREDFTNGTGGTIPALKSGFENVRAVYITGNNITSISVNDVPANALTSSAERFAQAAAGAGTGTVDVLGDFVLKGVSTSTPSGLYTATVVFTVG